MESSTAWILRRQPLNFPHDDPDARWSVYLHGSPIGVIVHTRYRSDQPMRWDWVIHIHAGRFANGVRGVMKVDGDEPTREEAMASFKAAVTRYLAYVGEDGWQNHLRHMAQLEAREGRSRSLPIRG